MNGTIEKKTNSNSFSCKHQYPSGQQMPVVPKASAAEKKAVKARREYAAPVGEVYARRSHTYTRDVHNTRQESVIDVAERSVKKLTVDVKDNQFINKKVAEAQAWLEIDAKELRVNEKRKKLPLTLIASICAISFSLMLIVAGSIMTGIASMELYAAENELQALRDEQVELENKLELKNDLMFIEREARERLGMIDKDFAGVASLANDESEGVTVYEKKGGAAAFASLLDALGFVGE